MALLTKSHETKIVAILSFLVLVQCFQISLFQDCRRKVDCHSSRGLLEDTFKGEHGSSIGNYADEDAHLVFPGGGIMFYWQAGVITYLREQGYELSTCTFAGASAGALTATLTTTEVDFYEATKLALKLAADAGVWDRRGGLQSLWGPLIEQWLDELLPESIESVEGRLSLLVTPIPSFGKQKVSEFYDKADLIRCCMASVHLPWFLDGKFTSNFRNSPHIDGSFLSKPSDFLPEGSKQRELLVLDWTTDAVVGSKALLKHSPQMGSTNSSKGGNLMQWPWKKLVYSQHCGRKHDSW